MSGRETARARLAVALDLSPHDEILRAARRLAPEVGVLKLGLQAFVSHGPALVREVVGIGNRVFLDLKLHDIPTTVGRAAAAAVETGVSILDCHAVGGLEMMRVFSDEGRAAAAKAGLPRPSLVAVTILTSLDAEALAEVGLAGSPGEAALRLALLSRKAGLDGVVCSPEEIEPIRSACGPDFLLIVPGVRPAGTGTDDQRRAATPVEAMRRGADLLVVGRPILKAPDPVAAARAIVEEITAARGGTDAA